VARIEVPMPQMGESIAEGTVSRWLKQLGEAVERDEPILEISTDKVDAEIPAPQSGRWWRSWSRKAPPWKWGPSWPTSTRRGAAVSGGGHHPPAEDRDRPRRTGGGRRSLPRSVRGADADPRRVRPNPPGADRARARRRGGAPEAAFHPRRPADGRGARRGLSQLSGSGHAGRVTKQDLEATWSRRPRRLRPRPRPPPPPRAPPPSRPATRRQPRPPRVLPSDLWKRFYSEVQHPEFPVREGDRVETMDKIRRLTAEHMVLAKRVAPHVHSFIEIDFTAIDRVRAENKKKWAEQGARVSYTAFVVWAVSRLLREFPSVNATASGNNIIYRGNVNIGIAVDLDPGLIVPVIRDADDLSLVGIGEGRGPGRAGTEPEAGSGRDPGRDLLHHESGGAGHDGGSPHHSEGHGRHPGHRCHREAGRGGHRPGDRDRRHRDPEAVAIFSLGYDHRIVDGADAARFLARLKETLETFPRTPEPSGPDPDPDDLAGLLGPRGLSGPSAFLRRGARNPGGLGGAPASGRDPRPSPPPRAPPRGDPGAGKHPEHLLRTPGELAAWGWSSTKPGRGGDVTYHGPGSSWAIRCWT
jgi:pyruvate dehydrogenase E2 component (dihydrolipoamide acetyltransferase)